MYFHKKIVFTMLISEDENIIIVYTKEKHLHSLIKMFLWEPTSRKCSLKYRKLDGFIFALIKVILFLKMPYKYKKLLLTMLILLSISKCQVKCEIIYNNWIFYTIIQSTIPLCSIFSNSQHGQLEKLLIAE